jgi:hypothetical protein
MGRAKILRDPTRIDLLFTMSEIPRAPSVKDAAREVMFSRTIVVVRSAVRPSSLFELRRGTHRLSACVAAPRAARRAKRGGARRDRTDDLMLAKHALSQLSYGPVS